MLFPLYVNFELLIPYCCISFIFQHVNKIVYYIVEDLAGG